MEEVISISAAATWITLIIVTITLLFHLVARKRLINEFNTINELAENNKKLSVQISLLKQEIINLNIELKKITLENRAFENEINLLNAEVIKIRESIERI